MQSTFQPDLHSYEFESDPLTTLLRLQSEDPVHWSRHGYWFITKFEDVQKILDDPTHFSSRTAGFGENNPLGKEENETEVQQEEQHQGLAALSNALALSFNQQDPPDHTRVRQLVNTAFSRREISERNEQISAIAQQLINDNCTKTQFDLVNEFAFPLPMVVSAEIIGIPLQDRERFRTTFEVLAKLMAPMQSEEDWQAALDAAQWLNEFMQTLLEQRQANPQNDLISALIQASEDKDSLSHAEIASAIMTIFTAAGTTTERLISNGAYLLLSNPEQLKLLKQNPDLIDNAIDEILRFHHPNQSTSTNRRATCDITLRGKKIKAGDTVRVSLGAANRDPSMYANPNQFDINRGKVRHLAFGRGIHFCLGSNLARVQAKIALQQLLLSDRKISLRTTDPVNDPKRPDRYKEIIVSCN